MVRALVSSNASQVEREVGTLAKALLAVVFAEGAFLLDESAFEVFLVRGALAHVTFVHVVMTGVL